MSQRATTTYSEWSMFLACRKKMEWRYLKELVPLDQAQCLTFGSLIHDCLEIWYGERDLGKVLDHINRAMPDHARDEKQHADWHLAMAMMKGYAAAYPDEDFEVVALEKRFEGPITNPETGRSSRSFVMAGKVDGIVKREDGYYLLEHKTASQVDAAYLEKLWGDFQLTIYASYVEKVFGIPLKGCIYNVLTKARLQQRTGETESEFEDRRAALIAKSKTGKSSAKRRMPETDEEFQERLAVKYQEPGMFQRAEILLSRNQYAQVQQELWDLSQALRDAKRTNTFLPNRSNCFQFGRACPYLPLCRSGGNPDLIENLYRHEPPHQELQDRSPVESASIF